MTFLNMLLLMDVLLKKTERNNKKRSSFLFLCSPVKTNETDLTSRPISLPLKFSSPKILVTMVRSVRY